MKLKAARMTRSPARGVWAAKCAPVASSSAKPGGRRSRRALLASTAAIPHVSHIPGLSRNTRGGVMYDPSKGSIVAVNSSLQPTQVFCTVRVGFVYFKTVSASLMESGLR